MKTNRHGPFDVTYVWVFLGFAALTLFVNVAMFASTAVLVLSVLVFPIVAFALWRHR